MYDVCVIGGGASGMSAAIAAARKGANVIILEKNSKLGRKLYATGNGRCNLSNTYMDIANIYFSEDKEYESFLNEVLGASPSGHICDFMNSIGILTYDRDGYIYPVSNQASSVVWAMIDELNKYGVSVMLKAEVEEIIYTAASACPAKNSVIKIKTNSEVVEAKSIVIATGGKSYRSLGGSEKGYELVKKLGCNLVDIRQSLCPLVTGSDFDKISGVRVNAKASLYIDDEFVMCEEGELQLTDYGLSGIMIFNMSSAAGKALTMNKKVCVFVDLAPSYDMEHIIMHVKNAENRTVLGALNGFINDRLAAYIIEKCGMSVKKKTADCSDMELECVARHIKEFKTDITSLRDFEQAQLSAGGISLSSINAADMSIKGKADIYVAGELIDIDGKCGGYNLTFAILSGIRAGESAYASD